MSDATDETEVVRFDSGTIVGRGEITPEGYLRVNARVTRSGVLKYTFADGSVRLDLRDPTEVFERSSLDSLKMRPVTHDHPWGEPRQLITAQNAKRFQVGHVGEQVQVDGKFVVVPLLITDGNAVEAIKNGRRQLSCGYTSKLIPDQGVFDGQPYTHRQQNIRYNHVALCESARVGPEASIQLDAECGIEIPVADTQDTPTEEPMSDKLVTITLDSIAYQAAPEVARELEKRRADYDALAAKAAKAETDAQAYADSLQAKLDAATAKAAELEKRDVASEIASAVKARVALNAIAARVLPSETTLDELDDLAVRKAVILAVHKDAKLDEKSDAYIQARFDAVVEALPETKSDGVGGQRKAMATIQDGTSADPRVRMIQGLRDAWKGKAA
jgi:uncharacterized protein